MIGRIILINSVLTLLMLGSPQAANSACGRRHDLPHAGQRDCSAVRTEEPARLHLELWRERRAFRTDQQTVSFQRFFSADRFHPSRLDENGLAPPEGGFIHATSRLVRWRSSARFANSAQAFEKHIFFAKLSIFSRLAPPCVLATARAMNTLGVRETMQQKLLEWARITQAYQFAEPGKLEPDFVTPPRLTHCATASRQLMPQGTCDPIRQHAALLEVGSKCRRAFADFPKGTETYAGIARRRYVGILEVDAWRAFQRSGCRSD